MQALTIEEYVVFHIPARFVQNGGTIGGRMRVTNRRILFDTLPLDLECEALEIRLSELVSVNKRNSYFIIPNGLWLQLRTGDEYGFTLWSRERLVGYLNRRIQLASRQVKAK